MGNRLKIVHVTFDMSIGGAEKVIYNLITNTDKTRYDASVLCLGKIVGPIGQQLISIGYKVDIIAREPGFDISLIYKIRRYVQKHKVDVLHCHQYTPYVYGVFGSMSNFCRVIFTEHGRFFPDERKKKRVLINPFLNLFTGYVTAISKATRDALVDYENFPYNKIKVVYNGIDDLNYLSSGDPELKKTLGIKDGASILGTVARLDSIKNQRMMINALKLVHDNYPDTYLIIVGDGPERKNLQELVSGLHVSSKVIFTGFSEEAHIYYKIMDMFLLTSFSEGTAMTLLEAMASGLPCIATNVGGNPEIVKDSETGILVPVNDEKLLADTICALISNRSLSKKLGEAGRKRYEEKFTVEKMVAAYQQMYGEE